MKPQFIPTVAAGLLFACASSQAQQAGSGQPGAPAAAKWETQHGVSYVCGGIGADDAAAMKEQAAKHDLMVTFATTKGDYLGEAHVTIADAKGHKLLDATCGGPIMIADLPKSGRYSVHAEVAGLATGGTVDVKHGKSGKPLALVWPPKRVEPG
jgi:hypothetical protein